MDPDALWARLERRRILVDPRVLAALRDVPIRGFVAPEVAPAAPLDAPLPTSLEPPGVVLPGPRYLAMLLQMLDVRSGHAALLIGSGGGYVEALLARLVEPARVTVWEEDGARTSAARDALEAHGFGERVVHVTSLQPDARFDRVASLAPTQRLPAEARDRLADMGLAVFRRYHEAFGFVKVLRSGDEYAELSAIEDPVGRRERSSGEAVPSVDLVRELQIARILENVWHGRPESEPERHFADVVADTFADPDDLPDMTRSRAARYAAARRLFQIGYVYQSAGDLEASADAYRGSLAVLPTAEAHTFLGWVYSFQDRYDDAIEECERAIAVDPSFGNPYNDIGAYLIELERLDEAIPWFEKAKVAERYCCHFYAHANLGRVYMMKGMYEKARREFEEALRINPEYAYARELLRRLDRGTDYVA